MKSPLYLIPVLAVVVFILIRAEFRKDKRQICLIKPICTLRTWPAQDAR